MQARVERLGKTPPDSDAFLSSWFLPLFSAFARRFSLKALEDLDVPRATFGSWEVETSPCALLYGAQFELAQAPTHGHFGVDTWGADPMQSFRYPGDVAARAAREGGRVRFFASRRFCLD